MAWEENTVGKRINTNALTDASVYICCEVTTGLVYSHLDITGSLSAEQGNWSLVCLLRRHPPCFQSKRRWGGRQQYDWSHNRWADVFLRSSFLLKYVHYLRKDVRLRWAWPSPPWCLVSVAATGAYHHVFVLFQDDIGVVIKEEHWDGIEFGGGTARLRYILRVHQVHLEMKENLFTFVTDP